MGTWETYLQHGKEFFKTAKGGYDAPEKFNVDALFNLVAISIEKMSMAFLMKNAVMPEGHTFRDLVASISEVTPFPDTLGAEIQKLDEYQSSFCSLEVFQPEPMTRDDIPPMLETCGRLEDFLVERI